MITMVQHNADGYKLTLEQFKARHRNHVYSGSVPPTALLDMLGYTLIHEPYTAKQIAAHKERVTSAISERDDMLRALAMTTLQMINELRIEAGLAAYTPAQFKAAVLGNVRDPR